jgi:hypothetical protein
VTRPGSRCRTTTRRLARLRARDRARGRPTGTGSRPYDPATGCAATRPSCCSTPTRGRSRGEVRSGPRCSATTWATRRKPSSLDSAGHVPRSLVTDPAFDWGDDAPPRRRYADTVIYEVHVKGFTMRHPDVPARAARHLRRARPRGGHRHLTDLGVTAVELLPVHQYVPEDVPARAGADQLLGLQHDRLLRAAPAYSAAVRAGRPRRRSGHRVQGHGQGAAPAGSRSSSTWSSTTPPRAARAARRCASAAWTTRVLPAEPGDPRASTTTPPAPATRSTPATRSRCG